MDVVWYFVLYWFIFYVSGYGVLDIWDYGCGIGTGDVIIEFCGFAYDFVAFVILVCTDDPTCCAFQDIDLGSFWEWYCVVIQV